MTASCNLSRFTHPKYQHMSLSFQCYVLVQTLYAEVYVLLQAYEASSRRVSATLSGQASLPPRVKIKLCKPAIATHSDK